MDYNPNHGIHQAADAAASLVSKIKPRVDENGEILNPTYIKVGFQKTKEERAREAAARAAKKVQKSPYQRWGQMNFSPNGMFMKMLSDERLTHCDKAVWLCYVSYIKIGNWVVAQQQLVAKRLGCTTRTLTTSTARLVECGYLLRGNGAHGEYKIPKEMAYCGAWQMFNMDIDSDGFEVEEADEEDEAEGEQA